MLSIRVTAPGNPSVTQEVDFKGDGIVFLQLRSAPDSLSATMEPLVYLNGVSFSTSETALEALSKIPASNVLEIEVLRGPVAAFLYPLPGPVLFQSGACRTLN